ncbi:unnamed protein product, partial [Musa banksii]
MKIIMTAQKEAKGWGMCIILTIIKLRSYLHHRCKRLRRLYLFGIYIYHKRFCKEKKNYNTSKT